MHLLWRGAARLLTTSAGMPVRARDALISGVRDCMRRYFRGKGLAELLDKQATARRKKLGMWQGRFQDPGAWRNGH